MSDASVSSTDPLRSQSHSEDMTFVIITSPDALKDKSKQQYARTKAIQNAKKQYRQRQRLHGRHFRGDTIQSMTAKVTKQVGLSRKRENHTSTLLSINLGENSIDPFETLPVNAVRLTQLL